MQNTSPFLLLFLILSLPLSLRAQQSLDLVSPGGDLRVTVLITDQVYYSVQYQTRQILEPSAIGMALDKGQAPGKNPRLRRYKAQPADLVIPTLYGKRALIRDRYNELILNFRED